MKSSANQGPCLALGNELREIEREEREREREEREKMTLHCPVQENHLNSNVRSQTFVYLN